MVWVSVDKPTASTYGYVNPQGKEFYNQDDVTYDSATTFYDGVNPNQWASVQTGTGSWVSIAKPT